MNKQNNINFNQYLKINQTKTISTLYNINTPRKNNAKLFKVNYTIAKLIDKKSNKNTINTAIEDHKKSLSNDFIFSDYPNNEKTNIRKQIYVYDFIDEEPIKSSILHIRTNKFQAINSSFDIIKKEESNYIKNNTEKKNLVNNLKYTENKNTVKNNCRQKFIKIKGFKTCNKISERKRKVSEYLFPLEECKKKYLFLNKSIFDEIKNDILPKIKI
jgi:hypothetical protein